MKRSITRLLSLSVLLLSTGPAWATAQPVVAMHTVTGFKADEKAVTVDISLHVTNPGKTVISNLTLSFVPLPPFSKGGSPLNVGTLAPRQSADLTLHLQKPRNRGGDEISRCPLYFAAKYLDAKGKPVEFPVTSHPGGGK